VTVTVTVTVAALLGTPRPAAGADAPDPTAAILLDYQASAAFRDRLRGSVALVRVEGAVLPGCDPAFRPILYGAATLVRLPGQPAPVWLTAAPLVRDAHHAELLLAPERATAVRVARTLDGPGVAVLAPERPPGARADRRGEPLAAARPADADPAPEALDAGRPVFTLENLASGLEVLLRGQVDEPGPPPLVDQRVVSITVGAGEPLFDVHGRFVGLCFRHLTATDRRCFASRAGDIAAALAAPAADAAP
jgi:hypothetical protein